MCREEAISSAQQLLTAINLGNCKHLLTFVGFGFCFFFGFVFFFDNRTCGIASVGSLDLTFPLSVLPRSVSKRCLCPSLSSVMVCDFKRFSG